MQRRFVVASAIAVVLGAVCLTGSGVASSAALARGGEKIPAGLAAAIHAQLGARTIRSSSAARSLVPSSFGFAVAVSADGTTALVGADGVGGDKGAAYIFHASAPGSWSSSDIPTAALTHKTSIAEDFGRAVALSANGTTAVVGAPLAGSGSAIGALYVFHVSAEDAWASSATPKATLKVSHDLVGDSVALSSDGTTAVVGAPGVNWSTGNAEVFNVADANPWLTSSNPTATLSDSKLPKPVCVVPRLVGEPFAFAKLDLTSSDCRLGKVARVHAKSKKWRKRIVSQSPAPGRQRAAGSRVKVKVGK